MKFNAPVGFKFQIGYINFSSERQLFTDYKISFLPVRAGVVGFLYKDIVFVSADAGVSKCHINNGTDQSGFAFGAGAGYKYVVDNGQFIQLSGSYNLHNFKNKQFGQSYNYNWFTIRLAYGLSWGKGKK